MDRTAPFREAVRAFKREYLARALAAHHGNRSRAALALGMQRTYLVRLIGELGVPTTQPRYGWRSPQSKTC